MYACYCANHALPNIPITHTTFNLKNRPIYQVYLPILAISLSFFRCCSVCFYTHTEKYDQTNKMISRVVCKNFENIYYSYGINIIYYSSKKFFM